MMIRAPVSLALAMFAACSVSAPAAQDGARQGGTSSLAARAEAAEFVRLSGNDEWARPPDAWPRGATEGVCVRVSEARREEAIDRLRHEASAAITRAEYRRFADANDAPSGTPYLLRGFSTTNSAVRVLSWGDAVIVESNSLGGLHHLRRHPCAAFLDRRPSHVYTYATYDE
jgi:hypothetical protein